MNYLVGGLSHTPAPQAPWPDLGTGTCPGLVPVVRVARRSWVSPLPTETQVGGRGGGVGTGHQHQMVLERKRWNKGGHLSSRFPSKSRGAKETELFQQLQNQPELFQMKVLASYQTFPVVLKIYST